MIAEPASVDGFLRSGFGSRQIEDDTVRPGILLQNLRHQRAVAATDVDHCAVLPEIVGFDRRVMPERPLTRHRPIEQRADLGFLYQVFVERHPQGELTAALSGPH